MAIKILAAQNPTPAVSTPPEPTQPPQKAKFGNRGRVPKITDPGLKELTSSRGPGRDTVDTAIEKMLARGDVTARPEGFVAHHDDPDVREEFGRLLFVGASSDQIRRILRMSPGLYLKMKQRHVEQAVESLADVGVIGMVALSFEKMEEASRRALQLAANMGDKNPAQLIAALRLVKDIESNKIDLLVRTGAIKVKKKVEISGQLVGSSTDLDGGEKAQRVMLNIMQLIEADTVEVGPIEGEFVPPEKVINPEEE